MKSELKTHKNEGKMALFGVSFDDISENDAVERIISWAKSGDKGRFVATVNVEFVMLARRNEKFKEIINNADLGVVDSTFLNYSKLKIGGKVKKRVTGVDLIEKICQKSADFPIRIGFLGGFGNVASEVAKRQIAKNPKLKISFTGSGNPNLASDLSMRRQINASGGVDILFVAYGMGKQEFWISRNKDFIDVGVLIGVGGAFDMISGKKRRAPVFFQKNGLEFLWRLLLEPKRIWRMRVLPMFFLEFIFKFFLKKVGLISTL